MSRRRQVRRAPVPSPRWNLRVLVRSLPVLAIAWPGTALGQSGLEVGAAVATIGDPPRALAGAGCSTSRAWAVEGRVGWRFSSVVSIEGTGTYHVDTGNRCVEPVEAPAPPTGPFERKTTVFPNSGYPFVSTDARLTFEPSAPAGRTWLRAFAGWGHMWSQDLDYWLAGFGVVFGGRTQIVADLEWKWFDVPFETTTESYLDGQLVSSEVTTGGRGQSPLALKLGFRLKL